MYNFNENGQICGGAAAPVTFVTPGNGEIAFNEIIDFMRDNNYSVSCRENPNLRIGIVDFFGDGDLILQAWYHNPTDFSAENEVTLRIGKRITKSRREAIQHFITDYLTGNLKSNAYSLA